MLASLLECSMAICPQQNRLQGDERLHSGEHQARLGRDHPEHAKHDRLGCRCSGETSSVHPGHDEVHPVDGRPGGEGPRLDEHLLILGLPGCPGEDQPRWLQSLYILRERCTLCEKSIQFTKSLHRKFGHAQQKPNTRN